MELQEYVPIGTKTTMKIGGVARYYAELSTREDAEEAQEFAKGEKLPLIVLGAGSNTVFADGTVEAIVVRVCAEETFIHETQVTAAAGIMLANLVNECATHDLDLSALTGIPGTFGGAIVGNAGQGPAGTWIDSYVQSVTAFVDGSWKTFEREECDFRYRESVFKTLPGAIVWNATLELPRKPAARVTATIAELLKKRVEAQPFKRTAGSCFKAVDGTPAWKLIDAAGLRGFGIGGVQISDKHANFLESKNGGTFADLTTLIRTMRERVPELEDIEMRLYGNDGTIVR